MYCPYDVANPATSNISWLRTPQPISLADGGSAMMSRAFVTSQSAGTIVPGQTTTLATTRIGVLRSA